MKKKLFFILIIISIIGLPPIYANNYTGSKTVAAYVQPNQGSPFYSVGTFGNDIGMKYSSESQESETNRTKFTFDLTTIPSNATITSVYLSYSVSNYGNSSYKFKVTQISNKTSYKDIWQNIGQATVLFSDVDFSGLTNLSSSALTTLVNNNKGGTMYLGAFSQDEFSSDSYANLDLTLTVTFSTSITADNNFTASNGTHGVVIVNGTQRDAPYSISNVTVGSNETFQAVSSQTNNQGYQMIWHTGATNPSNWTVNTTLRSTNQTYNFTVASGDLGQTFVANLRKVCNVTAQNGFVDVSSQGLIIINGDTINISTSTPVVEGNNITIGAPTQIINSIKYTFDHWYDGNTQNPRTFTISSNFSPTAYYKGIPIQVTNRQYVNTTPGNPIQFTWDEQPNTNVTKYYILRKVKHSRYYSVEGPDTIAILNRGTLSYTDYLYGYTSQYTDDLLWYDVRPYYSTEQSSADSNYLAVFGGPPIASPEPNDNGKDKQKVFLDNNIPKIYSLAQNYPNPFNPSTQIKYAIKQDGFVTIKVYDILGKVVATLVNENKSAGFYIVNFDASSLSSGIYFYTIKSGNFFNTKKMLLLK